MYSKKQEKKYLDSDGTICPNCGSENIKGGDFNVESGIATTQKMFCNECGEVWYDVYNLAGIQQTTPARTQSEKYNKPIPLILTQTDNEDDSAIEAPKPAKPVPNFLAAITTIDGNNECTNYVFIRAKDITEADSKIVSWLTKYCYNGHWQDGAMWSPGGCLVTKCSLIEEITDPLEAIMRHIEVIE